MNIEPICRHEFRWLLLYAAAAPFGFACSSDVAGGGSNGGAAPSAGAPSAGAAAAGAPSAGAPAGGAPGTAGAGTAGAPAGAGGASAGAPAGGSTAGGAAGAAGASGHSSAGGSGGAGGGTSGGFVVSSPDQADGAKFGTAYTCAAMSGMFGSGVNPELDWTGVPAGTMSFAITFIDTKLGEANMMGQHWAMWNIPAAVRKLAKGTTAISGDLTGAKQTNKYLSPCPSGDDTYEFTVYALSTATLAVDGAEGNGTVNSAGVAKVLTALKALTPLGTAKLHGTSGAMGK